MSRFKRKPEIVEAEQWFPDKPLSEVKYPFEHKDWDYSVPFHSLHGKDDGILKVKRWIVKSGNLECNSL